MNVRGTHMSLWGSWFTLGKRVCRGSGSFHLMKKGVKVRVSICGFSLPLRTPGEESVGAPL